MVNTPRATPGGPARAFDSAFSHSGCFPSDAMSKGFCSSRSSNVISLVVRIKQMFDRILPSQFFPDSFVSEFTHSFSRIGIFQQRNNLRGKPFSARPVG